MFNGIISNQYIVKISKKLYSCSEIIKFKTKKKINGGEYILNKFSPD